MAVTDSPGQLKNLKNSFVKIRKIVTSFSGQVSPDETQVVLAELGILEKFLPQKRVHRPAAKKRIHWPKKFSIATDKNFVRLVEVTPSYEAYCSDTQYDHIVAAIINMQMRGEDFNRFTLPEEVQKDHPEITSPAILACLHLWFSIPTPLLRKNGEMYQIKGRIDDFEHECFLAWDILAAKDLHVTR